MKRPAKEKALRSGRRSGSQKVPTASKSSQSTKIARALQPKHTESALVIAEQRYRALVRATSSLVWMTLPNGEVDHDPEWAEYTGMSNEEVKGWGWIEAVHPDDRERTAVIWQQAVDTGSLYELDYRIRRKDGVFVWHHARGVPILTAGGAIKEWVGICVDIDARKKAIQQQIEAEQALRNLNENLEKRVEAETRERLHIWNVSQDLLVLTDLEGMYLSVNPAWPATLGWSESELLGKTSQWLLHPEDREKTRAEIGHLAAGRKTVRFESRFRHKDGSYRWISWKAVPDRGRIYATGRDVTELKDAENALRNTRRELAEVARRSTLAVMTAAVAHELRQPLTAIISQASAAMRWMYRSPPDLDAVEERLKKITEAGHRASDVIESIRTLFTRGDQGRTLVDANEIIRETIAIIRGDLDAAGVSVQFELNEELPQLSAHKGQLQQVLLNIVTNATDAMRAVTDRARVLQLKSEPSESNGVTIAIEDSGMGIDEKDINQIFNAFFTTKKNGMGMGLAICQSIVEAHGGRLSASARMPHGCAFCIALPGAQ